MSDHGINISGLAGMAPPVRRPTVNMEQPDAIKRVSDAMASDISNVPDTLSQFGRGIADLYSRGDISRLKGLASGAVQGIYKLSTPGIAQSLANHEDMVPTIAGAAETVLPATLLRAASVRTPEPAVPTPKTSLTAPQVAPESTALTVSSAKTPATAAPTEITGPSTAIKIPQEAADMGLVDASQVDRNRIKLSFDASKAFLEREMTEEGDYGRGFARKLFPGKEIRDARLVKQGINSIQRGGHGLFIEFKNPADATAALQEISGESPSGMDTLKKAAQLNDRN